MNDAGRILVIAGVVLVIVGGLILLVGRAGIPLGRLPGDFTYRGKNTVVYFPLATSILVSVILSIIFWLISRHK